MAENNTQNVLSVSLAQYIPTPPTERDEKGWVRYGDDNGFPQYLCDLVEGSPTHSACVVGMATFIAGKGVQVKSLPTDQKQADFDKQIALAAQDYVTQGGYYLRVIYSSALTEDEKTKVGIKGVVTPSITIARIIHEPFECMRHGIPDANDGKVRTIYKSNDWKNSGRKGNKPVPYPVFNPKLRESEPHQIYYKFSNVRGARVYPKPDYVAAINWIEAEREIGVFDINELKNNFFPGTIISMFNGQPTPEAIEALKRQFYALTGANNAGKYIFLFNEPDTKKAEFESYNPNDMHLRYEGKIKTSRDMIFVGHRITTPLIFGVRDSGSGLGSNSNEMQQGWEILDKMVIQPRQRFVCEGPEEIMQSDDPEWTCSIIPNSPISEPTATPAAEALAAEKKKPELTETESHWWLEKLSACGEVIDLEEWELLDEQESQEDHDQELSIITKLHSINLANEGSYANGEGKSKWGDAGLFKLRYAYSKNIQPNSRQFCKRMVAMSLSGKVFRQEDIIAMGNDGVNGQFAPEGQSTYDLFLWKGGVYCHHKWVRQIYMRKRGADGKILPNDGLKNDIRVANNPYVPQKGPEGTAPINTPTRGSLKNA